MFADRIENLKLYIPYNAKIKVVCDYLAKTDIHALEVGKYDIADGVRGTPPPVSATHTGLSSGSIAARTEQVTVLHRLLASA